MRILCRFSWHDWKPWVMVPATPDGTKAVLWSGLMRQCRNCLFVEGDTLKSGFAFDLRPLRNKIREHVADLRRCVTVIDGSEFADGLKGTRDELEKAANELEESVRQDEHG